MVYYSVFWDSYLCVSYQDDDDHDGDNVDYDVVNTTTTLDVCTRKLICIICMFIYVCTFIIAK